MTEKQAVGVPLSSIVLDSASVAARRYARTGFPRPDTVGLRADSGTRSGYTWLS